MSLFKTEEDFRTALNRLNHLGGWYGDWSTVQAQKDHTDEFGVAISHGEVYYTKDSTGYSKIKFSRTSMEKVLYAVVATSPQIETLADKFIMGEAAILRATSDKVARSVSSS